MREDDAATLPESIRDWDEVKNSEDLNSFWDQMKNMRSKIGTGLYAPSKEAGSEDWGKFSEKAIKLSDGKLIPRPDLEDEAQRKALYKTLGVPDELTGYEFDKVEGSDLTSDRMLFLQTIAHKAGLTKDQLKSIDSQFRTNEVNSNNEAMSAYNDDLKKLNVEWGLAFDDRSNSAKKVVKSFFPHLADDAPLSASELKSFYSLYSQLSSSSTEFKDQSHNTTGGISPSDALNKISEVMNNKDHPYNNISDPGNPAAQEMMRKLYLAKNNMK